MAYQQALAEAGIRAAPDVHYPSENAEAPTVIQESSSDDS